MSADKTFIWTFYPFRILFFVMRNLRIACPCFKSSELSVLVSVEGFVADSRKGI